MDSYEQVFNERGKSYHVAMAEYPEARDLEFETALSFLSLKEEDVLLDLPAGGGYLQNYLPEGVKYKGYDFSAQFDDRHGGIIKCSESYIDLPDKSVDHAVTLAAYHHMVDRGAFFQEIHRVLKDGGNLLLADVLSGSQVDPYLNVFVHEWNSMGHAGNFITLEEDRSMIESHGFKVTFEEKSYPWKFESKESACRFFRLLFGMDRAPSDNLLHEQFHRLGILKDDAKGFWIKWALVFLICKSH